MAESDWGMTAEDEMEGSSFLTWLMCSVLPSIRKGVSSGGLGLSSISALGTKVDDSLNAKIIGQIGAVAIGGIIWLVISRQ